MRCFQSFQPNVSKNSSLKEEDKFLNEEIQHTGHTVKTSNYSLKDIVDFDSVMLLKV